MVNITTIMRNKMFKDTRFRCKECNFPNILPESPNSSFGKIVFWRGVSWETICKHYRKYHPEIFKKEILPEIRKHNISYVE